MSSRHKSTSDGDWICSDTKCENVNFARRTSCNRCGKEKLPTDIKSKGQGYEIGKAAAEKSHGLFSAEDWQCTKCGNVNWARRSTCNLCNAPKVGDVEERTGYGGGFNEREGVEYVRREDSDDEWNEYGIKKKKYRGNEQPAEAKKPTTIPESESEEDEDGDLSKYDLWDDDEEEDKEAEEAKSEEPSKNGNSNTVKKTPSPYYSSSSRSSRSSSRSSSSSKSSSRSHSKSPQRSCNERSRSSNKPSSKRRHSSSSSRSRSRSTERKLVKK